MANVTAPSQPTLTALRTEDLSYRLSLINARFGTSVTIADLTTVTYDAIGIFVVSAEAVVANKTYTMWRDHDTIYLYRIEADGSRTFIAQLN